MKVLIVDDEASQVSSLDLGLRSKGFQTIKAYNARDALSILSSSENKIDLVITDYYMPELDGLELIRSIKYKELTVPVIMITGNGNDELKKDANQLGCTAYLEKPFTAKELFRHIHSITQN